MHQSPPARDTVPARRSIVPVAIAVLLVIACTDNDALRANGASGGEGGATRDAGSAGSHAVAGTAGSGSGGLPGSAGSSGLAGNAGSAGNASNAGFGGVAGNAGFGGVAGNAGSAGDAGSAGAGGSGLSANCAVGGALFVVGNYSDAAGNQLILRAAAKAATFAWVPAGVASPTSLPKLYLVNRVCAPGGALLASDGSSSYRLHFSQMGGQIAVCLSTPVPTLEAASALPRADITASTGCAGHAFTIYTAGSL